MRKSPFEGSPGGQPPSSPEHRERFLPLINAEESRFIENVGGEYEGFVDRNDGKHEYQDVVVSHHAFYDPARRAVVEAIISTEAVNDEGGNEMQGERDLSGYSTLIVYRTESGDTIEKPRVIRIDGSDIARKGGTRALRHIARTLLRFVSDRVSRLSPDDLAVTANALLAEEMERLTYNN
jgi:hypothetical protein